MAHTPDFTNGRIRVRPEQIEYLDDLLHRTWIEVSQQRARLKDALDKGRFISSRGELMEDPALITHMNRELRLIASIQREVDRTREEMESR